MFSGQTLGGFGCLWPDGLAALKHVSLLSPDLDQQKVCQAANSHESCFPERQSRVDRGSTSSGSHRMPSKEDDRLHGLMPRQGSVMNESSVEISIDPSIER